MIELSGYTFSPLRADDFALYRGLGDGLAPILLVAPGSDGRLKREYALKEMLSPDWAARPLALVPRDGDIALILDDPGGAPLDCLLGRPLDVMLFLRIAISLAATVRRMHEQGLIHKDIKPRNVLVDIESGGTWLTGFGIASRLPRERPSAEPPEVIAGTLAYMAPEQTGRMNRSIDSRSDLYALGVTFYEMLTGTLPFDAAGPMEWIHCHIARQPVPPSERVHGVPSQLSAIVMKLLAKTADERYQTAAGIEADLRRCLAAWESVRRIDPFPLATQDASDRLIIPERLYGRQREIDALLAAFDRVAARGNAELVLVSGYSGIGKSSVVNELHKIIVQPRGIFISGKFDLRLRDIPYSTLAQAFQGLIRQILGGSEEEIGRWRDPVQEAVGQNGRLVTDLIPDLAHLIGTQPPATPLPATESQVRFQSVFQSFLGVFARPEHPLVIFIDDLQWIDRATLTFIEHLIGNPDTRYLLLVGAYRDNEVAAQHPLLSTLEAIRQTGVTVVDIVLGPLSVDDVTRLVCDTLRCTPEFAQPLAALIHRKTGGNPFFAGQFLANLAEEGLLSFEPRSQCWKWNLDSIDAKGFTENVVNLMIGRLERLSPETQDALKLLACLGNRADLPTLVAVRGSSEAQVELDFGDALRSGAVYWQESGYRFLHDRVQEAAYAIIPEESRAQLHLQIGRRLVSGTPPEEIDERIFDIVNQLNSGSVLIADWDEKKRVAEFNLRAGKKAKASTAYTSASHYLAAGMALLGEHGWRRCYDLTFGLCFERAECELLSSNFEATARFIEKLLRKGRSKIDRAHAYYLRMELLFMQGDNAHVTQTAHECLQMFDLDFTERPTQEEVEAAFDEMWLSLGERSIESLIDLPLVDDREMDVILKVVSMLIRSAYFADHNLCLTLLCRAINLTLVRGMTQSALSPYAMMAFVLGPALHRYHEGDRFGQVVLALVEKHNFTAEKAMAYDEVALTVIWTRPIATALSLLESSFRFARENSDIVYSCYSLEHRLTGLLARGEPLNRLWTESVYTLDFVERMKFRHVADIVLSYQSVIQSLRGQREGGPPTDDTALDARVVAGGNPVATCFHWILQLQRHFLLGDTEAATAAAAKAEALLWATKFQIQSVDYCLFYSLVLTETFEDAAPDRQATWRNALAENLTSLRRWSESCPQTFLHKYLLVSAELARIDARYTEAMRLYDEAAGSAADNGFIHYQALANELAGRFYLARGLVRIAHTYLRDARDCYLRWGARGKVAEFDRIYPDIVRQAPPPAAVTIEAPVEHLDIATLVKASQAISSEIVLGNLIETLMVTAVEHAGADRGVLILVQGNDLRIGAEAITGSGTVAVQVRTTDLDASKLPISLIYDVRRTSESVCLDDTSDRTPYSADPYIRRGQCRSILCLPLVRQATLTGVLYLENSLASHVFTPARAFLLRLLASQAAISIENARLYADLQTAEQQVREAEGELRLVINAIPAMAWSAEPDGSVDFVNDGWIDYTGMSLEGSPGYGWWAAVHPGELDAVRNLWQDAVASGKRYEQEARFRRADGEYRWFLVRATQLRDELGKIIKWHGTCIDIDDSKRTATRVRHAEDQLQQARAELAHVARLTTAGELTAMISHEVNQPLAALVNNASACLRWLAADTPDLEEIRQAVEAMRRSGHRASEIIGRIRTMVKKSPPRKDWLSINDTVTEVIGLVRNEIERSQVSLWTEFTDDLPLILGDRVELQQVVLNLIMNAIEAMNGNDENRRELVVTSAKDGPRSVLIAVRDSGTGLDEATLARLFDAFYTTKPNGMGMGLAISRTIIEAHGGQLWATNNQPQGATFHLRLPTGIEAG